jgi:DHA1 family tetracycline resistance protein-like MFS transporter
MTSQNRRAEIVVLVAVFLDMIGIGIAFPTFPILIGHYTHSPVEQAAWYAILMGAYASMQFVCAPLMGALSDRFGRRPILLITIAGLSLHYFLLATAPNLFVLLFARFLGGITGASFSVASAYLADISPPEERAKAFGKIGAAFGLGFIIGPVLGGYLGHFNMHLPFFVGSAFSALNFIYAYFMVKESLPRDRRTPFSFAKANPFGALYQLIRKHALGMFVIGFALLVLAQNILIMGWVLYTNHRFGWDSLQNGYLLAVMGLLAAIIQGGLVGILVKTFGERRLAIFTLALAVGTNILYGLATEPWMMYAILVVSSLGFAGGPAIQGIISKTTDPSLQGVTMGALQSLQALSQALAPWIAGAVLTYALRFPPHDVRVGASFFLSAALDLIALLFIWAHLGRGAPVAKPATLGDLR